jgi:hypothetical protein
MPYAKPKLFLFPRSTQAGYTETRLARVGSVNLPVGRHLKKKKKEKSKELMKPASNRYESFAKIVAIVLVDLA